MTTYEKGNLSEAMITARLIEAGYNVLIPVGGGHRYDLVIDTGTSFKRIQVKTGHLEQDRVVFNVCSNNKGYKRKSYHGDIDIFAVYCPELKTAYLIPVEKTGASHMALRLTPPKNNQLSKVNLAENFAF